LGIAALSLAGAWIGTRDSVMHMITVKPFRLSSASDLASLGGATAWLNSAPLTAADLQGKVVLVNFWTYTCINWLRTLPYVRAWAARYKEQGLVVIGVHTPEFSFEENVDSVRKAAKERGVTYPIAIDNGRAIWSGFGNHRRPHRVAPLNRPVHQTDELWARRVRWGRVVANVRVRASPITIDAQIDTPHRRPSSR
jgi:thiol-disulfide isomerase/thioredoxin